MPAGEIPTTRWSQAFYGRRCANCGRERGWHGFGARDHGFGRPFYHNPPHCPPEHQPELGPIRVFRRSRRTS